MRRARQAAARSSSASSTRAPTHEDDHTNEQPAELFAEDVNRGYRLDVEDQKQPGRVVVAAPTHRRVPAAAAGRFQGRPAGGDPARRGLREGRLDHGGAGQGGQPVPARSGVRLGGLEPGGQAARAGDQQHRGVGSAATRRGREPVSDAAASRTSKRHRERCRGCAIGRSYRFRARAVDLAGNSVRDDDLVPQHVTPRAHVASLGSGAVARGGAAAAVHRRRVADADGDPLHARRAAARVRAAPAGREPRPATTPRDSRTSTRTSVTSRRRSARSSSPSGTVVFDAAIGQSAGQPTLDSEFDIAARESGSFLEAGPNVVVVNPIDPARPDRPHGPEPHEGAGVAAGRVRAARRRPAGSARTCPTRCRSAASFTALPGAPGSWLQQWEPTGPERALVRPASVARPHRGRRGQCPCTTPRSACSRVKLPQAEMVTVQPVVVPRRRHAGTVRPVDVAARDLPQPRVPAARGRARAATGC